MTQRTTQLAFEIEIEVQGDVTDGFVDEGFEVLKIGTIKYDHKLKKHITSWIEIKPHEEVSVLFDALTEANRDEIENGLLIEDATQSEPDFDPHEDRD